MSLGRAGSVQVTFFLCLLINVAVAQGTVKAIPWQRSLGHQTVQGFPIAVRGMIVAQDTTGTMYAFNRMDGTLLWKTEIGCAALPGASLNDMETIFFIHCPKSLVAVTVANGKISWRVDQDFGGTEIVPVFTQSNVLTVTKGVLCSFDHSTGKQLWCMSDATINVCSRGDKREGVIIPSEFATLVCFTNKTTQLNFLGQVDPTSGKIVRSQSFAPATVVVNDNYGLIEYDTPMVIFPLRNALFIVAEVDHGGNWKSASIVTMCTRSGGVNWSRQLTVPPAEKIVPPVVSMVHNMITGYAAFSDGTFVLVLNATDGTVIIQRDAFSTAGKNKLGPVSEMYLSSRYIFVEQPIQSSQAAHINAWPLTADNSNDQYVRLDHIVQGMAAVDQSDAVTVLYLPTKTSFVAFTVEENATGECKERNCIQTDSAPFGVNTLFDDTWVVFGTLGDIFVIPLTLMSG